MEVRIKILSSFSSAYRFSYPAYESAEYQELSKIRKSAIENATFTIMEGIDEAAKLRRAMGK
tara:strand:- start:164 stop:349 length:186 start_codon:yes stop_codon:yes gene_type:complete